MDSKFNPQSMILPFSILFSFAENRCAEPPHVDNAMVKLNTTDAGNDVTYTCNPGYAFPDNDVMKLARCKPDLQWSDVGYTGCRGNRL